VRRFFLFALSAPLVLWLLAVPAATQVPPPAGTVARIQIGDVLSTGPDARLEIRMTDDAVFTLGAQAAFVVTDYTFGQAAPTATFRVLQGAFLATSGKIAQLADNSMKVTTEAATIGIRGTTVWGGPIDGQFGVILLDGRAVTVENAAGRVDLTTVGAGTGLGATGGPTAPVNWAVEKVNRARETVAFR
jgi:hypothetical protein